MTMFILFSPVVSTVLFYSFYMEHMFLWVVSWDEKIYLYIYVYEVYFVFCSGNIDIETSALCVIHGKRPSRGIFF